MSQAEKDVERIRQALLTELKGLDSLCHDWASWDDAYEFVQAPSPRFIEVNLIPQTFSVNKINLLHYLGSKGDMVWGKIYDLTDMKEFALSEMPSEGLPLDHPLIEFEQREKYGEKRFRTGIVRTQRGPMLVASRPVLNGSDTGSSAGFLIMGRLLSDTIIQRLNEQTGIRFAIQDSNPSEMKPESIELVMHPEITSGDPSRDILVAVISVADLTGNQAFALTAELPRSVSEVGKNTVFFSIIVIIGASVLVVLALLTALQKAVARPLTELTCHAELIGEKQDLSLRTNIDRKDEIGRLSRAFDGMIQKLQDALGTVRKSEEMFRTLTESSLAHVMLIQGGKFVYVNPAAARDLECKPAELIGRAAIDFIHPEDVSIVLEQNEDTLAAGNKAERFECRYMTSKGNVKWVQMVSTRILYDMKPTVFVHGMDITDRINSENERHRLEEQLRRSEKMEAMGLMAGGVAHDLNNMLGGVVGFAELVLMTLPEDSPVRSYVKGIMQSGQRAAAMIQDMLSLTRRGVVISEVVNPNDVISMYMESPEFERLKSYHPQVEIVSELAGDLLNIKGSPVHLSKAVMNLVSNAAEAVSAEGTVTIKTENRHVDRPIKGYDTITPGDYAVLAVSDTGTGISDEDIGRIFEPFYTKKTMGRSGTGLGLAVVWGTVKDHRGHIDVKSKVSEGTTFSIYFPATMETAAAQKEILSRDMIKGRGEAILVVDDIEDQRRLAETILVSLGYKVASVPSGEEAISYIRSHNVDLILLDMIMDPGIDGLTTYERIMDIRPGLKAILVSGFSETDRVKKAQRLGAGQYVKKPYLLEAIGLAVRKELDRKAASRN